MIEETATVVAATPDHIWVEARARSACSSCGTQDSCATSSVSKLFGMRRQQLRLPNQFASSVGEQVIIGVEDQVMVTASLAAYILPVVLMIVAASREQQKVSYFKGDFTVALLLSAHTTGYNILRRSLRGPGWPVFLAGRHG